MQNDCTLWIHRRFRVADYELDTSFAAPIDFNWCNNLDMDLLNRTGTNDADDDDNLILRRSNEISWTAFATICQLCFDLLNLFFFFFRKKFANSFITTTERRNVGGFRILQQFYNNLVFNCVRSAHFVCILLNWLDFCKNYVFFLPFCHAVGQLLKVKVKLKSSNWAFFICLLYGNVLNVWTKQSPTAHTSVPWPNSSCSVNECMWIKSILFYYY